MIRRHKSKKNMTLGMTLLVNRVNGLHVKKIKCVRRITHYIYHTNDIIRDQLQLTSVTTNNSDVINFERPGAGVEPAFLDK